MGLFHVLFAITFPFGLIGTGMKVAAVQGRCSRMFVINVSVSLFFGWPPVRAVLASRLGAFPGTRMSLLVLTGGSQQDVGLEDGGETYVKSQGRLNSLSQSRHLWTRSLGATSANLRLRAIERVTLSSSDVSKLSDLFITWCLTGEQASSSPVV